MSDINLLPKELSQKDDGKRKRSTSIVLVLLFILLLVAGYAVLYGMNRNVENELSEVESKITALAEVQARKTLLEKKQAELVYRDNLNTELDTTKINFYNLLSKVETTLPDSVSFTTQNTGDGAIRITGVAEDRADIAAFAAKINQIDNITNVWINSVQATEDDEYTFNMDMVYSGGEEE